MSDPPGQAGSERDCEGCSQAPRGWGQTPPSLAGAAFSLQSCYQGASGSPAPGLLATALVSSPASSCTGCRQSASRTGRGHPEGSFPAGVPMGSRRGRKSCSEGGCPASPFRGNSARPASGLGEPAGGQGFGFVFSWGVDQELGFGDPKVQVTMPGTAEGLRRKGWSGDPVQESSADGGHSESRDPESHFRRECR